MAAKIDLNVLSVIEGVISSDEPMYVLNLLRFRDRAEYPAGVASVGETGREAYFNGYLPAFGEVAQQRGVAGVAPVWIGEVSGAIAGEATDRWDMLAIVSYAEAQHFRKIVDCQEYRREAEPFRLAALEDWRLIAHRKIDMPR
jgi:hypothetical protein